jgi:hypothetical protein
VVVLLIGAVGLTACSRGGKPPEASKQAEAFDDLRTEIRAIVSDPDRSAEALRLVDTLEQELLTFEQDIRQRRQRMQALNADYDASRADIEALAAESGSRMRDNRKRIASWRQALCATLSDDELEAIERTQTLTIKSAINSLNAAYMEV